MQTPDEQLNNIFESFLNGQRKQFKDQVKKYGVKRFMQNSYFYSINATAWSDLVMYYWK